MSLLNQLRQQPWLHADDLPPYVRIPAKDGVRPHDLIRPVLDVTVAELTAAIQGFESELDALCGRLEAVRQLRNEAQRRGAPATSKVADAFATLTAQEAKQ